MLALILVKHKGIQITFKHSSGSPMTFERSFAPIYIYISYFSIIFSSNCNLPHNILCNIQSRF